jgi:hypothetical protein
MKPSSASPELDPILTRREIDQSRCDILSDLINPYAGDVYRSALICFDRFSILRESKITFNANSNYISGGLNAYGEPEIHIGTEASAITPRMKSRIDERFGLPEGQDFPDGLYKLFVLAHEIGHVIQKDPLFSKFYGDYDTTVYSPEKDYPKYANSENEVLADYIAAQILSNTELGAALGMSPPTEEPPEWRQWGEQNHIDKTIELYRDIVYDIIHE